MVKSSIIGQYLANNKNLIPLFGDDNIPSKNWTKTIYSQDKLYSDNGNIAWALSHNDLIIDVDPRNDGDGNDPPPRDDNSIIGRSVRINR